MGKNQIKGVSVRPLIKTSWIIRVVTCKLTMFSKWTFKTLKLRISSHSNIKCRKHQGLKRGREACLQRTVGLMFDTWSTLDLKELRLFKMKRLLCPQLSMTKKQAEKVIQRIHHPIPLQKWLSLENKNRDSSKGRDKSPVEQWTRSHS